MGALWGAFVGIVTILAVIGFMVVLFWWVAYTDGRRSAGAPVFGGFFSRLDPLVITDKGYARGRRTAKKKNNRRKARENRT